MARKGRNNVDHNAPKHKYSVSGSIDTSSSDIREKFEGKLGGVFEKEDIPSNNFHGRPLSSTGKKSKKNKSSANGKKHTDTPSNASKKERESGPHKKSDADNFHFSSDSRKTEVDLFEDDHNTEKSSSGTNGSSTENLRDISPRFFDVLMGRNIGGSALHVLKTFNVWVEKQKPQINTLTTVIHDAHDYVCVRIKIAYPILRAWILHIGKIMFLLSILWLDCGLRGFNSLIHLGTTSFIAVIWCSIFSLLAMIGITKMFIIMVSASIVAVFVGLGLALIIIVFTATVILWIYGSFWTTGLIAASGGALLAWRHERVALLLTTVYSAYCAKSYVGWFGLLLGINLSFISSDILIYILKNYVNDQRFNIPPEQEAKSQSGTSNFFSESTPLGEDAFNSSFARPAHCDSGTPSTSGSETEMTSENEVARLLTCNDHYSALGFGRYENIDISSLKREYRKKAMLVHPDKNMGNEKAAEAFKKIQNAYEVLLDSLKRKTYDDELRREEIMNYFRRFQSVSPKNFKHGVFGPGYGHYDREDEGLHGESRRIACKKCNDFHIWVCTNRPKSQARRCQDCKDFHQAKDGDGWVEQSFQPVMFGLMHKMDPSHAYVCAESRIYDVTEWFICQGMRCPVNTHKPSFNVNTSLASKYNAKGASSSNGGMPVSDRDHGMPEELFEWLQNAMQSGAFATNDIPNECSSARTATAKSNGSRKRRKGKK